MAKIRSIIKLKNQYKNTKTSTRIKYSKVYDIEVADNHNYLANKLLVSNSAAETYRQVNKAHLKDVYFRVGFTATNFRNDGSDMALESVLSEVLYEYPIDQAIKDEYLMQPEFERIKFDNMDERTYQQTYKRRIVENGSRNAAIADVANHHKNDHVIILVQQIEHGVRLKKLIKNAKFINGQEKDLIRQRTLRDFRNGKLKCLIGTTVLGEGVDLPVADTLIMAGGGKSKIQVMQNIGRVLRIHPDKTDVLIYDFTDKGSKWLNKHSLIRQEVYKQYKI